MRPTLNYVIPLVLYLSLPILAEKFLGRALSYAIMVGTLLVTLVILWKAFNLPRPSNIPLSIAVGMLVGIIWIVLDGTFPLTTNPESWDALGVFLGIRILGSIIVAPFVEELFTRDFLVRYLSASDWQAYPIGKFSVLTFTITIIFFGFAHASWLSGLIAGVLFNLLLMKTKNISSSILAHSISNVVLVLFSVMGGSWHLLP